MTEVERLKHEIGIHKRTYERLNICPDHRDKATGRCIVCDGERRGKLEERERLTLRDAAPEAERPRTTPEIQLYNSCDVQHPMGSRCTFLSDLQAAPAAPASVGGLVGEFSAFIDRFNGSVADQSLLRQIESRLTPPPPSAEPPRWTREQVRGCASVAALNGDWLTSEMLDYLFSTLPAPETDRRTE